MRSRKLCFGANRRNAPFGSACLRHLVPIPTHAGTVPPTRSRAAENKARSEPCYDRGMRNPESGGSVHRLSRRRCCRSTCVGADRWIANLRSSLEWFPYEEWEAVAEIALADPNQTACSLFREAISRSRERISGNGQTAGAVIPA